MINFTKDEAILVYASMKAKINVDDFGPTLFDPAKSRFGFEYVGKFPEMTWATYLFTCVRDALANPSNIMVDPMKKVNLGSLCERVNALSEKDARSILVSFAACEVLLSVNPNVSLVNALQSTGFLGD